MYSFSHLLPVYSHVLILLFNYQPDLPSEPEDDVDEVDGVYAFKRRRGCRYLAVGLTLNFYNTVGFELYKTV